MALGTFARATVAVVAGLVSACASTPCDDDSPAMYLIDREPTELMIRDLTVRGNDRPIGSCSDADSTTKVECSYTVGGAAVLLVASSTFERVELRGNSAGIGGALYLGEGRRAVLRESTVVGNDAGYAGGGVLLGGAGAELISEHSDWGGGAEDNTPEDVALYVPELDSVKAVADYGADASFECSGDASTCF